MSGLDNCSLRPDEAIISDHRTEEEHRNEGIRYVVVRGQCNVELDGIVARLARLTDLLDYTYTMLV